jgi:hypothetical protein
MNGTQTQTLPNQGAKTSAFPWVTGSSIFEASGAFAVIALAIVGLAGVFSGTLAAIATIILGAAILIEGGTMAMISERFGNRTAMEHKAFTEPLGFDFMGGLTAVVLGILALLGLEAQTLLSVAVLVLGASFLFGSQGFIGLAAVVLGILAVIGVAPMSLTLVGLLVLGVAALVGGGYIAGRSLTGSQPRVGQGV